MEKKLIGRLCDDLEQYFGLVSEAIVREDSIAITWRDDDGEFHSSLRADDGGFVYQGHYGPRANPKQGSMKGWSYKSTTGEYMVLVDWKDSDGYTGTWLFELYDQSEGQ